MCKNINKTRRLFMADKKLFEMVDVTDQFDKNDIETNKVMGILGYIGPLCFVPMFARKDSKFSQFTANQGLVLFIIECALSILSIVFDLIPYVGWLLSLPCWLLGVGTTALSVLGIVNSARGLVKKLPIVGGIKILK